MIPRGLCQCGCGRATKIWSQSINSRGIRKGDFRDYVSGHGRRCQRRVESKIVVVEGVECRTVPLTKGQVAIVDLEDYERVAAHLWFAHWNKHINGFYARRNYGGTMQGMHAFIMNVEEGKIPDHETVIP